MSKHLGNIVEPMPLMEEHGADAVRWFMAVLRVALGRPAGSGTRCFRRSSARCC